MAKKSKSKTKPIFSPQAQTELPKGRTRKLSTPRLRFKRTPKPVGQKKLPSVYSLIQDTKRHIWRNKKTFLGVLAIYLLLNLIFVKGFASTIDIHSIKNELSQTSHSAAGVNLALVSVLFGSGNSASTDVGSLYQSMILVIFALVFIWLFRHTSDEGGEKVKIRQPFYEGMTPLIPFLIVMCVVGLGLVPMLIGFGLLSTVLANGLATSVLEQILWSGLALVLTMLTFYFLSSSIFALIIVTLPNTAPLAALRSAKKVVVGRRWQLMRKLLFIAITVGVGFSLLIFLSIAIVPILAEWIFFVVSSLLVPVTIGIIYKTYRALL